MDCKYIVATNRKLWLTYGKDAESEVLDEFCREVQGVAAEIRALVQKIGAFLILCLSLISYT